MSHQCAADMNHESQDNVHSLSLRRREKRKRTKKKKIKITLLLTV